METPIPQCHNIVQQIDRRASMSSTSLNKMGFDEKLDRYRILLEKEYELRAKLSKEYGTHCGHNNNTTLVCNCGRLLSTAAATTPTTNRRRSISPLYSPEQTYNYPKQQNSLHHLQKQQNQHQLFPQHPKQQPLNSASFLTPPVDVVRYRSNSDKIKRTERVRPLSADVTFIYSAAALRRIATEEKMGKRRDSLRSLQDDFDKAKSFMRRARAFSNGSIQYDISSNNITSNDTESTNNIRCSSSSSVVNKKSAEHISPNKKTSNDSGHFSSNESMASTTSSQDISSAVTKYIETRRKERPQSSYL